MRLLLLGSLWTAVSTAADNAAVPPASVLSAASIWGNVSSVLVDPPTSAFRPLDDRPPGCPPCFNCQLDAFECRHYAPCNRFSGKCVCPPGFGGDDCAEPVCGSLAAGPNRPIRPPGEACACDDGWDGVNCNVCQSDEVCEALVPGSGAAGGAVCFADGLVRRNYQMCDVTNRKILDQLKDRKPQVTFSCDVDSATCSFQCMSSPSLAGSLSLSSQSGSPI